MAIYHCSLRTFSRKHGHSAVAAAAYRSGARLRDERTGIMHRYEKRKGVKSTFILAPHGVPKKFLTRVFLWNAAEASENRKNSRVAREVILALPHELSDKARAELARDMGLYLTERYRVAVDVAIHSPVAGDSHDPRNYHAHLLFTTRELGQEGFGAKTRILDDKITGPQEIEIIRAVWETLANDELERTGFPDAKIDRRTLEAQGIDRIPQTHEGKAARNASVTSPQSLLSKDFKKADRGEDDEEAAEGEEEGTEGEGSSSGSAGSSGNQSPNLQSKPRKDSTGRKIDYTALDQERTRTTFNDEIKALNEKRAAFGDKPLKAQIAQLDRLMEKLDRRVQKLQAIESKTSVTATIKQYIASAAELAAGLFINRSETRAALILSAAAKQARKERQFNRYGRRYRAGLHEQIKEMKRNIAIIEAKREDFRRYKSFVDTIDRELKKHSPSITTNLKESDQPVRQITDKGLGLRLSLKAEMIRNEIPIKYRPPAIDKGDRKTLTNSTSINQILQTKNEPIRLKTTATPEAARTMVTNVAATKPEQRQNWFIQGGDKMKPFTQSVNKQLDRMYEKETFAPDKTAASTGAMKDVFGRTPKKRTTTTECLAHFKTKSEEMRATVPERHRGKSYDDTTDHSFNAASKPPEKPKQPSFRLNKQFNMNSRSKDSNQIKQKPGEKPEADV